MVAHSAFIIVARRLAPMVIAEPARDLSAAIVGEAEKMMKSSHATASEQLDGSIDEISNLDSDHDDQT
jgi:hypothetical protein